MPVAKFTFNQIQENTYVLYDETKECIIIDPGCVSERERERLTGFIADFGLSPVRLINTHCHVDHIPGNPFIAKMYDLDLEIHRNELQVLAAAPDYAAMFLGEEMEAQPEPKTFLEEGMTVDFGKTSLQILFTPGHSPGSLSFFNSKEKYVVAGDVLFYRSVGRYDLPGADGKRLLHSIREKLFTLPDDTIVYSGHGPETKIGDERILNPFVRSF